MNNATFVNLYHSNIKVAFILGEEMLTIAKLVIFLRFDTDGSLLQEFIWKQIVKLLDSRINITMFAKLENKE